MPNTRTRRGATLIELLVALLLLDLALVTLAAMSAVSVRRIGEAGRRSRSVMAAGNRVESMSARGCVSQGGAASLERGVIETWNATSFSQTVDLVDSVRLDSRTPENVVYRTRSVC